MWRTVQCGVLSFQTEDIKEIAKKIANMSKKNEKKKRLVVFTQGAGNTIVASGTRISARQGRVNVT